MYFVGGGVMLYQNPVYNIFNQSYIEEQLRMQHHNDQVIKSLDCAKKLEEFIESMNELEPEYQQLALSQCCLVIEKYINNSRN